MGVDWCCLLWKRGWTTWGTSACRGVEHEVESQLTSPFLSPRLSREIVQMTLKSSRAGYEYNALKSPRENKHTDWTSYPSSSGRPPEDHIVIVFTRQRRQSKRLTTPCACKITKCQILATFCHDTCSILAGASLVKGLLTMRTSRKRCHCRITWPEVDLKILVVKLTHMRNGPLKHV